MRGWAVACSRPRVNINFCLLRLGRAKAACRTCRMVVSLKPVHPSFRFFSPDRADAHARVSPPPHEWKNLRGRPDGAARRLPAT